MKNLDTIRNIISNIMSDEAFEIINNAEFDRWDLDKRIARNGLRRLVYNLRKWDLTLADWDLWCAD